VLAAIAACRKAGTAAASELRARLRGKWDVFRLPAALAVKARYSGGGNVRKASEMLEVFLGPDAAEALRDDAFRGLDWAERPERYADDAKEQLGWIESAPDGSWCSWAHI